MADNTFDLNNKTPEPAVKIPDEQLHTEVIPNPPTPIIPATPVAPVVPTTPIENSTPIQTPVETFKPAPKPLSPIEEIKPEELDKQLESKLNSIPDALKKLNLSKKTLIIIGSAVLVCAVAAGAYFTFSGATPKEETPTEQPPSIANPLANEAPTTQTPTVNPDSNPETATTPDGPPSLNLAPSTPPPTDNPMEELKDNVNDLKTTTDAASEATDDTSLGADQPETTDTTTTPVKRHR